MAFEKTQTEQRTKNAERHPAKTELQRFHRTMSLALLLATIILTAEIFRYPPLHDREALVALLLPLGLVQRAGK